MKVCWYFELEDFTGYNLPGLWQDLKIDAAHVNDYRKITMVGDKKWQEWMAPIFLPVQKCGDHFLIRTKRKPAKQWIKK